MFWLFCIDGVVVVGMDMSWLLVGQTEKWGTSWRVMGGQAGTGSQALRTLLKRKRLG
jgi:hypothetical protein